MASLRNHWVGDAWIEDSSLVERWFDVTTKVSLHDETIVVLRRVLGWDGTEPPRWVRQFQTGRVSQAVTEVPSGPAMVCLGEDVHRQIESDEVEVRRVLPPIHDWNVGLSSESLELSLPVAVYEVWNGASRDSQATNAWREVDEEERKSVPILENRPGYVGSILVLLPRPTGVHFEGVRNIRVGDAASLQGAHLVSEVLDGPVVIERSAKVVELAAMEEEDGAGESARHLRVHFEPGGLEQRNRSVRERRPDALCPLPTDRHGPSGSDWRVSLVCKSGAVDAATVGLIRGFGNTYRTSEPWLTKEPGLGFSAPAQVTHVETTEDAKTAAFSCFVRAGSPVSLADRYSDAAEVDRLRGVVPVERLLVGSEALSRGISEEWARSRAVRVRVLDNLHDRFLLGPKRGFLLGTSLNGLGKRHSFIVEMDATARWQVSDAFERLWQEAQDPWSA